MTARIICISLRLAFSRAETLCEDGFLKNARRTYNRCSVLLSLVFLHDAYLSNVCSGSMQRKENTTTSNSMFFVFSRNVHKCEIG